MPTRPNIAFSETLLREQIDYDPETGTMLRRAKPVQCSADKTWNTRYAGKPVGHTDGRGYIHVMLGGNRYLAHRLAWFYVHGRWPAEELDHINGDPSDNRLANLREATRLENSRNCRLRIHSKVGIKGVHFHKKGRLYGAKITVAGTVRSLGYYKSALEAGEAYQRAADEAFGAFAR